MSYPIVVPFERPSITTGTHRALVVCGLWMRAAFVGASATVIGVIQLFNGEWSALSALSAVLAGVALAAFSWRRAHAALSDADKPAIVAGATLLAAHR